MLTTRETTNERAPEENNEQVPAEETGRPMCDEGLKLAFQFVKNRLPDVALQKCRQVCKKWNELITTNRDILPRCQFPRLSICVEKDVQNLDFKGATRNWSGRKECPCYEEAERTAEGLKGLLMFPEMNYHARVSFHLQDIYIGVRNLIASKELTAGMLDMAHLFRHLRYAFVETLEIESHSKEGDNIAIDPQLFQVLGVLRAKELRFGSAVLKRNPRYLSPQMRLMQLRDVLIGGHIQADRVHCEHFHLKDDDEILDFLRTAGKGIRHFEGRHSSHTMGYTIPEQMIKFFLETDKPLADVVPSIRIYNTLAKLPSMFQKPDVKLPRSVISRTRDVSAYRHRIVSVRENQHSGKSVLIDLTVEPCFNWAYHIVRGRWERVGKPSGDYKIIEMKLAFD